MKRNISSLLIVAGAAIMGFLAAWFFVGGPSDSTPVARTGRSASKDKSTVVKYDSKKKRITEIRLDEARKTVRIVETEVKRPDVTEATAAAADADADADEFDEQELTEIQKSVLVELQDALDENNLKKVRKALSKFVASSSSQGGHGNSVPKCMRMRAVEALGWFGKEAVDDLAEYIADPDPEVASDAMGHFEMALQDCEMSDYERAELVQASLKALRDSDSIETMLDQLNNMRNSVKAETAVTVLSTGTPEAKALMAEQLEFYFECDVTSADAVQKWLAMNPDDPDDNEMYGVKPKVQSKK